MGVSDSIVLSLVLCGISLFAALFLLRRDGLSLGLPIAYLFALCLEHVPGAYAHLVRPDLFITTEHVALGIWRAAVGSLCFVVGLSIARAGRPRIAGRAAFRPPQSPFVAPTRLNQRFWFFCLFAGWLFVYGLSPLRGIPSLGALIEKGGAIWMLGVMLGLRDAAARSNVRACMLWLVLLSVYPVLMLILGGFLSYGSAAAIITLSVLAVSVRSIWRVLIGTAVIVALGLTIFVNYFVARDHLRSVLWSGAGFEARVQTVVGVFSRIEPLNLDNDQHATSLDARLNQNYFAGLAAERLDQGWVDFLQGQSFYEAVIAVIPRAVWPDKPVVAGSGTLVRDMTGLELSTETSWGVGQVMEFYMNFGWPSLVIGFALLGWLIGRLDWKAA